MRRRAVIVSGAAAAAAVCAARAQPARRSSRIGILSGQAPGPETMAFLEPIRRRLAELGHVDGSNLEIAYGFAEGKAERWPVLAAELLARNPDVLVGVGPIYRAAAAATQSVPVVALAVNNPVREGLAKTMARPGGNVTGVSSWGIELVAKRLQILKDLVPDVRRVGLLNNPHAGAFPASAKAEFERRLGIVLVVANPGSADEFDAAFAMLAGERVGGIIVFADPLFYLHRARIAEWCARHKLPSVWGHRGYLDVGGLASYQSDFTEVLRRGADQIDQILKGTHPGEIPFEQATKLELVVSLKAARVLGLKVPQALLLGADEVIE
jgi:putative ABC transport system substrate-binding protein